MTAKSTALKTPRVPAGSPAVQAGDELVPCTPGAGQGGESVGPRQLHRERSRREAHGTHQLAAAVAVRAVTPGFELLLWRDYRPLKSPPRGRKSNKWGRGVGLTEVGGTPPIVEPKAEPLILHRS